MSFWDHQRVVVTGGSGFLGSHVVDRLKSRGSEVFVPRKKKVNLIDFQAAKNYLEEMRPTLVIHGAAYYGGIGINQMYPGKIYFENLVMGANVMEAARLAATRKFIAVGTACSYPGYLDQYLKEDNLWDGLPHETVVNYGMTKKMMAIQGWAYRKQYGFDSIHVILTNLYGPRDTFNPVRSHVVSALIRKFVEAKKGGDESVEVWGTGKPVREFLYVDDCAEAIIRAAELYDDVLPLNIGTGLGTSVRELATAIADIVEFRGKIEWNTNKPDGQMVKILDVTRMKEVLKWCPPTSLREGLERTIAWYVDHKETADQRE